MFVNKDFSQLCTHSLKKKVLKHIIYVPEWDADEKVLKPQP